VTNTCCSHPLHSITEETDEKNGMGKAASLLIQLAHMSYHLLPLHCILMFCDRMIDSPGVKIAAVRKLDHELGIQVHVNDIFFMTRFLYQAVDEEGGVEWGEHERMPRVYSSTRFIHSLGVKCPSLGFFLFLRVIIC
jgi:isopentenyldiphosphate isomerase